MPRRKRVTTTVRKGPPDSGGGSGTPCYFQQNLSIFRHPQYQEGLAGGAILGPNGPDYVWPGTAMRHKHHSVAHATS